MAGINHDQVRTLRREVYDLMVKEDCLWHQRSRVQWLKAGDMNTGYFHSRANQRNRRNNISKLVLDDGAIIEEERNRSVMRWWATSVLCSNRVRHPPLDQFFKVLNQR